MKCAVCQTENREARKFCKECGAKLLLVCANCQHENVPGDKYCGECGQSLSDSTPKPPKELSFDEKLRKIQKYLPGGLTEKILAQKGKIEGERKQVTVLFADMENFTPLVEKIGPEEAYAIMDQVYEILIHKVHEFEGTVNEMTGDGIMALFGAPIALEDAPQRAIRSALAIHQEITKFSDRVKQEKGIPPIRMRIGIHMGPVVVGTLGNDLRVEFKAVGDTVNLASRIQNLAPAGTTFVSEDLFKLTEGFFRFESLGSKEIKGKEQPIGIYQVIAPSSSRTRFDVNAERGLTVFVGRTRELENLLDGLDRAKSGRGQAFSLIGEAGVGKSRLLYEFRKSIANENISYLEGKCLSYGRGAAYHPIIDILKASFNIQGDDPESKIKDKVANALKALKISETFAFPFLLELLSIKDSGIKSISMTPEGKRDRLIEIIKQIMIRASEYQPIVISIEDLHWVDKSTEDILKYLLESIPGARIFMIFTYRPEYVQTWGRRAYHNQITLNRLSTRESLEMVVNLLGEAQVDGEIEDLFLSRTEGIPFFIEEFIKSLKDLRIIEQQNGQYKLTSDFKAIKIPSSIQDVIMARVDALPEEAKEILRCGSVIEREFGHKLLTRIMSISEQQLLSHLSILKDSELIYERGIYPDLAYIFKHALTREVIYDSILIRKKKQIHEKIVVTLEDIHQDDICYHYGLLAGHCIAGENYQKGAEYARLEARRCRSVGLYKEAIEYEQKGIDCLEKMPQTEVNPKRLIDARTTLAIYYSQINRYVEAKRIVDPIADLAIRMGYKKRIGQIYGVSGEYYLNSTEDFPKALQAFENALKLSEEVKDRIGFAMITHMLGRFYSFNCEFEKAMPYLQTLVDGSIARNDLERIAFDKAHVAFYCYFLMGKMDMGSQTMHEAISIAEKSEDIYIRGFVYVFHGTLLYGKGLFESAERALCTGIEILGRFAETMARGWGQLILGESFFERGDFPNAQIHYVEGCQILEMNYVVPSWVALGKSQSTLARIKSGDLNVDLESLYNLVEAVRLKAPAGWISKSIGEILLNVDDAHMSEAETWIQRAIDLDFQNGMRFQLGRDHALYSEWFKHKGDHFNARENLGKAIGIMKECGSDGWVEKYQKELATLR